MCGIAGVVRFDGGQDDAAPRMAETLSRRGPDDAGRYFDGRASLAHRRLSIIDLSPQGRQPLSNEDETLHAVVNGEFYGYEETRRGLADRGHVFRSRTDSEILLHLYEEKGEAAVEALDGMFALALWDAPAGRLLLARDPLGKKPLYYARLDPGGPGYAIAFASEPKALLAHPGVSRAIDPEALDAFLVLGYVPSPLCIFRDIRKLPPGSGAVVDRDGLRMHRYFLPRIEPARWDRAAAGFEEELAARLRESVRRRLVADVEVGLFLSGGVDSSLLAALVAERGGGFKTFSIGFGEGEFDESPHAERVSRTLGAEHIVERVEPETLMKAAPGLVEVYDEPFADASAIPTFLLARLAARHVKVALGGDGADELFGGYPTLSAQLAADRFSFLAVGREPAARLLDRVPDGEGYYTRRYVLRRFVAAFDRPPRERQLRWTSYLSPEELAAIRPGSRGLAATLGPVLADEGGDAEVESLLLDQRLYLPDDILVKVDRATMGHALETRCPFLDRGVVEAANRLPRDFCRGKAILKRILRGTPVAFAARRRKHGFTMPVAAWLRTGLREWSRERIEEAAGLGLERPVIERLWSEHQDGRRDRWRELWALAALGAWRDRWARSAPLT